MTTRFWPQLRIEDGPPIAGLAPGDAVALVPGYAVYLKSVVTAAQSNAGDGDSRGPLGLDVRSSPSGGPSLSSSGALWRIDVDTGRLETGVSERVDEIAWGPADRDAVTLGRWRLRVVVDGPPLATVKTILGHAVAHPTVLDADFGKGCSSTWVSVASAGRTSIIVTEWPRGTLTAREAPRHAAFSIGRLRELAGGPLDAEIAAGIVAHASEPQGGLYLGFDGAVHAAKHDSWERRYPRSRGGYYSLMTRGRFADNATDLAQIAEELAATRAATREEIGDVVRALAPLEWARERALLEEIGLLPTT